MKNILIATDFSKGSDNAIYHARKLAQSFNCSLVYFHAYSPPILDPNMPVVLIEETYQETVKIFEERLQKLVNEDKSNGISSNYSITFSDLKSGIEGIKEKKEISLLIVGKTGQSGFLEFLLGSTATHLISEIDLPIMIIPEKYEEDILFNIGYSSQLEFSEIAFIKFALEFSKKTNKTLKIINIETELDLNLNPDETFLKEIAEALNKKEYELLQSKQFNYLEGILEIIKKEKLSILNIASHKRNFLSQLLNPSKTKMLIEKAEIPIVVFTFGK
jgi:nucleotide-binding universal stress UspA family protein